MIITKNDKIYNVKEFEKKWVVSTTIDKVAISFDVSKDLCKTDNDLRDYVLNNDTFF